MITLFELLAKIGMFGIDWFISNKETKDKLRKKLLEFIKWAGRSSKTSSDLNKEYDDMIKDEQGWKKKK